jgi:hypothetical protein
MHPRSVAAIGLLLVGAASFQWGTLAFPGSPTLYAPLWLEGAGLALAAVALVRGAAGVAAVGFGVACLAQTAFLVLFAAAALGAEGIVSSLLTMAGYGWTAWAFARGGDVHAARGGLVVAAASTWLFAALDLASGSTFLLVGYLMAIPGWLAAVAAGWMAAPPSAAAGSPA